jgi:hypothetical protein
VYVREYEWFGCESRQESKEAMDDLGKDQ